MNYPTKVRAQLDRFKIEIHLDAIEKNYLVTDVDIKLYVSILMSMLNDTGWLRNDHDRIVCYDDLTAELKKCADINRGNLYISGYFD